MLVEGTTLQQGVLLIWAAIEKLESGSERERECGLDIACRIVARTVATHGDLERAA